MARRSRYEHGEDDAQDQEDVQRVNPLWSRRMAARRKRPTCSAREQPIGTWKSRIFVGAREAAPVID